MLRIKVIGTRSLIDDSTYVYRNEYEFVYDAACREYDWLWVDDRFPKKDVGSICSGRLVEECFPKEAFIAIPSDNPSRALAIINEAIANDEYSKRREAIEVARNLILEKYNPYAQIVNIIEGAGKCPSRSRGHDNGYICSRHRLRLNPVNALTDAFEHILRLR